MSKWQGLLLHSTEVKQAHAPRQERKLAVTRGEQVSVLCAYLSVRDRCIWHICQELIQCRIKQQIMLLTLMTDSDHAECETRAIQP